MAAGRTHTGSEASPRVTRVVHAVLGLVGIGLTLYGGSLLIDAIRFAAVARPATGTVVSVETVNTRDSGNAGVSFLPTIRYETARGAVREAETQISSTAYDFRTGETVEILYDPARPEEVRLRGLLSLWALPVAFFGIGVLLLAAILASALGAFDRRNDAPAQ